MSRQKKPRMGFLKSITLSNLVWLYVDDRGVDLVVRRPHNTQTFKITWKRLDRLRKQAAEARAAGEYRP